MISNQSAILQSRVAPAGFRDTILDGYPWSNVYLMEEQGNVNPGTRVDQVSALNVADGDWIYHGFQGITRVAGKRNYAASRAAPVSDGDRLERQASNALWTPSGVTKLSASLWLKPPSIATGAVHNILAEVRNAQTPFSIVRTVSSGGKPLDRVRGTVYFGGQSQVFTATSAAVFTAGNWHHVVMTADSTNGQVRIYVNNSLVVSLNTTAGTGFYQSANTPYIFIINGYCTLGGGWQYANQTIDEVYICRGILDVTAVSRLYNGGTGRFWYRKGETA
jgi:hypothetical protein